MQNFQMGYSLDFRKRVMADKEANNLSFQQTSDKYNVSMRSLFRWADTIEPCTSRDKPATKIDEERLLKDIEEFPDAYQFERAERLMVTQPAIHYALKRLHITYKKTLKHPKANEELRTDFRRLITQYENDGKTIVYLDESGFAQDMPRTHGYSAKGVRSYGTHDWHSKGRLNAIGAIIGMTFLTLSVFDCSINSDVFYAWLTQDLLPKVKPDSVIVMDNATFHKRSDMLHAIESYGCIPAFLPPYSPDLNPIEKKWAQAKSIRRKLRCQLDELFKVHLGYATLF